MTSTEKVHATEGLIRNMPKEVKDQTLIELARRVASLEGNDPDQDALFALHRAEHIAEGILRGESRSSLLGP